MGLVNGNFNFGASTCAVRSWCVPCSTAPTFAMRGSTGPTWLASAKWGALMRHSHRALLSGVNFSDAVFQSADLRGADPARSNLFGADLSRVRLDGSTSFDGALLQRARTWPRSTLNSRL